MTRPYQRAHVWEKLSKQSNFGNSFWLSLTDYNRRMDTLYIYLVQTQIVLGHAIQELFHVYLNIFEIALSHLVLIIFGNNNFTLDNLITRTAQSPRKYLLTLLSVLKPSLKRSSQSLSVWNCCLKRNIQNCSRTISLKGVKFFSWNLL